MTNRATHTNTKAILRAWERLSSENPSGFGDPKVSDFPNMLGSLFVLKQAETGVWPFVNAGNDLTRRLGRDLIEHDFLSLWRGRDVALVSAQLDAIRYSGQPGVVQAVGETLSGQCVALEIALAPLRMSGVSGDRFLGLYQLLEDDRGLAGRPVWRHSVSALYPPEVQRAEPKLRLVASNE